MIFESLTFTCKRPLFINKTFILGSKDWENKTKKCNSHPWTSRWFLCVDHAPWYTETGLFFSNLKNMPCDAISATF